MNTLTNVVLAVANLALGLVTFLFTLCTLALGLLLSALVLLPWIALVTAIVALAAWVM